MKKLIAIVLFITLSNTTVCLAQYGSLTDPRDGNVYRTIQIKHQIWMAENLAYVTNFTYSYRYPNKITKSGIYCFDDDTANCRKYGMLYTLEAALNAFPVGWHLPTKAEYDTLFLLAGGDKNSIYQSLIEGGSLQFDAIMGGCYAKLSQNNIGHFSRNSLGTGGYYWTSSRDEKKVNSYYYIDFNSYVKRTAIAPAYKLFGFSVRCITNTTE
jgi:uncharacterized protein (TIGR02145 family)